MSFSFQGFGPMAILIMVLSLVIAEVYKFFRDHR